LSSAVESIVLRGALIFYLGYYEAKTTVGSLWKGGLEMASIGLGESFAGF